jgi:hypothetical protein
LTLTSSGIFPFFDSAIDEIIDPIYHSLTRFFHWKKKNK